MNNIRTIIGSVIISSVAAGGLCSSVASSPLNEGIVGAKMLSAWEGGKIAAKTYYADTSVDYYANYLSAYMYGRSLLGEQRAQRQSHKILQKLKSTAILRGGCLGWGLNAPYDAFRDGTTNPANTIYLYTTGAVVSSLLRAERAKNLSLSDDFVEKIDCTFEKIFNYQAKPFRLRYSANENDNGFLVYPVLTYFIDATLLLAARLNKPELLKKARTACKILISAMLPDGTLPYRKDKQYFSLIHHAQSLNGILICAQHFKMPIKSAIAALDIIVKSVNDPNSRHFAKHPVVNWQFGEALIALKRGCNIATQYCAAADKLAAKIIDNFANGAVFDKNPRSQSWIAAGLLHKKK